MRVGPAKEEVAHPGLQKQFQQEIAPTRNSKSQLAEVGLASRSIRLLRLSQSIGDSAQRLAVPPWSPSAGRFFPLRLRALTGGSSALP
jgi:hypothetical protein